MADDMRISTTFVRHPKTLLMIRHLGFESFYRLVSLFLWATDNRPDGNLAGKSDDYIEIAAGWEGERGLFVKTLNDVGFLDGEPGNRSIHNWEQRNPWVFNRPARVERARNAAAARWDREQGTAEPDAVGCSENATSMLDACDSHDLAMPHSPPLHSSHHTTTPHTTTPPEAGGGVDFDPREAKKETS